jgi:hypothetical protein
MRAVILATLLVAGCGGDNTTTVTRDLSIVHDMASICGHPGDTGNSLGVGKYCKTLGDCTSNTKATLCSILGSDNSYFCTFVCTGSDLGSECGENATCQCQGGQCGCFPDACK